MFTQNEEDEEDRKAKREAALAMEVKKHLTNILIEVTDKLFGEW